MKAILASLLGMNSVLDLLPLLMQCRRESQENTEKGGKDSLLDIAPDYTLTDTSSNNLVLTRLALGFALVPTPPDGCTLSLLRNRLNLRAPCSDVLFFVGLVFLWQALKKIAKDVVMLSIVMATTALLVCALVECKSDTNL